MAVKKQARIGISIRAYADRIGVDEKTVRKARDAGSLGKGYNKKTGKILPEVADEVWGNNYKLIKPKNGVGIVKVIERLDKQESAPDQEPSKLPDLPDEDIDLITETMSTDELLAKLKLTPNMKAQEAMRINSIIDVAVNKKKLQEVEGKLISREKVEKTFYAIATELKKSLFNMPQRVVRQIMNANTEVEGITILADALTQILNDYGNLKSNSLN